MSATTPRTLTLRLPSPPAELSPNARCHWGAKARYVAAYRSQCCTVAQSQRPDGWTPLERATLRLTFWRCYRQRRLDNDNAESSFKAGRDALVDAGILRDDSARRVAYGAVESVKCPRGCRCGGGVEIVVEEITP